MKKKIAIIGVKGLPAFGGAARACESIVEQLKDKFDFTIYSISTHTNNPGYSNGYFQIVLKGTKGKRLNTFLYYIKSTLHALFFGKYDLVHVNHLSCGFIVPFLRIRYKVVSTIRGVIPADDNKWNYFDKLLFNFFSILLLRFSNHVISVSQPHIQYFKKYTQKNILYIPNRVSVTEPFKLSHNISDNYLLFAASRIISLKGCHIFLESLKLLDYKGRIIIIGDLEQTPDYSNHLVSLSKTLNIIFKGLIKDKSELYSYIKNARLFVFPSFNEGMSNILLEAASLKTPIICSDIIENKAVFSDNEVQFFNTGNEQDLANKIEYSLNNYDDMIIKANNAFEKVVRNYAWEKIAAEYENLYLQI